MHDVAWRCDINCVRSKDAHKQLARTSLNEIRRRMTTVDEELEGQDARCIDTEPEKVDELYGDVHVQIIDNDMRNDEKQMIQDTLEIMRSG